MLPIKLIPFITPATAVPAPPAALLSATCARPPLMRRSHKEQWCLFSRAGTYSGLGKGGLAKWHRGSQRPSLTQSGAGAWDLGSMGGPPQQQAQRGTPEDRTLAGTSGTAQKKCSAHGRFVNPKEHALEDGSCWKGSEVWPSHLMMSHKSTCASPPLILASVLVHLTPMQSLPTPMCHPSPTNGSGVASPFRKRGSAALQFFRLHMATSLQAFPTDDSSAGSMKQARRTYGRRGWLRSWRRC
eukprot:703184-Pelagomonas_calceolata.AAC.1